VLRDRVLRRMLPERSQRRDFLEVGGQAAMAGGGCGSLATWKRCPKPVPSVPL
jgi:hypothetical protein